ncbi:MAG: capsular polysaccharide biosynthesis protein [Parcubacteria group bacterium GW2011_GWC1_43_12]|nr:MAG: capsular polysaccharide biosynthesis protein [Parcubacteria group bacterium GW2011_GWB1_42_6]KKS92288.1 MAG: capsular polysaccharide biosynthesis protein [Parcubacteria group bacterium GW2011_GWC1_43_12]
MKIFLIGFSNDIFRGVAEQLAKEPDFEIAYWTCRFPEKVDRTKFPEAVIHFSEDAIKGIPARDFNVFDFEPLGEELAGQMYECESHALTMMNRMHFSSSLGVDQRKRIYYGYLKYWNGILKKFQPEAIVFSTIPHMGYDYVLYCLAKNFGVKTLMFDLTRIPDRIVLMDDFKKGFLPLKKYLAEMKKDVNLADLDEKLRNYYSLMSDKEKIYYPLNIPTGWEKALKNKRRVVPSVKIRSILRAIKNKNLEEKLFVFLNILKRRISVKKMEEEYSRLQLKPDLNKKFIYFPLHVQPECTTSPLGGIFADQLLVVEMLAKALPEDWLIYVKEHKFQLVRTAGGYARFPNYYKFLTNLKNVNLAPMNFSSNELILKSQAVATITGSAGWEALFREKPVLAFGYPVYQFCDGVFRVSNFKECQEAILAIVKGFAPDKQKVLNFLSALNGSAIKANLNCGDSKEIRLSEDANIKNISEAIHNHLFKNHV